MKTYYECVPCMINSLINLFNQGMIDKKHQDKVIKEVLKYYSEFDFEKTPLLANRNLHRLVRELINDPDPYKKLKDKYNNIALEFYEQYKQKAENSNDPFKIALRLAIAGNIIDFGPGHTIDVEKTIDKVISHDFPVDHTDDLREEIKKADSVLFLADNTGEIVFDKLLIETINHPNLTLAVRHSPILNDATLEDVKMLGLDKITKVITNGDNAPGTLITEVSDDFLEVFNSADLIISKGQGNYEGLNHIKDRNIYFLLMAKCNIVADFLGVKKGDCVISKTNYN